MPAKPPFDVESTIAGFAMYTSAGSLAAKLKAIWAYAQRLILETEKDHGLLAGKVWGTHAKDAMRGDSMHARSLAAEQFGLGLQSHSVLMSAYFEVLGDIRIIHKKLWDVRADDAWQASVNEGWDSFNFVCHPDHLKIERYRDEVVPCFFALQLHCYFLKRRLEQPSAGPSDPRVRKGRAVSGGKASNHGEELLRSDVMAYLTAQPAEPRYKSVAALFDAHVHGLARVLDGYLGRIGKAWNGQELTYGQTLKPEGLKSKIQDWKHDERFHAELARICNVRK